MATTIETQSRVMTDETDTADAQRVLESLAGPSGFLAVGRGAGIAQPLPPQVGMVLQEVLQAIARGSSITVMATPLEITTSTAAAMLGVSRPTVMKMVKEGQLPAHRVGSHTRLRTADVMAARRARRMREREAFAELLELEGDEI